MKNDECLIPVSRREIETMKTVREMLAADADALRAGRPERVIDDLKDCIYRLSEILGEWDWVNNKPIYQRDLPRDERCP